MTTTGIAISLSKASSLNISILKELEIVTLSFVSYFLLHFFRVFPTSISNPYFKKIEKFVLYFGILNISIFIVSFIINIGFHFLSVSIVINLILSLATCIFLIFRHFQYNSDKVKNQLYILSFSIIFSFSPVLLLSLIPGSLFRSSFVHFEHTIPFIILFPLSLAYLLTRQQIIDFQFDFKVLFYKSSLAILIFGIGNRFLSVRFGLKMSELLFIDLVFILLVTTYIKLEKLLKLNDIKKHRIFKKEIENNKLLIQKHLLEGNHLITCAKMIIEMTHRVVRIDGACIKQYNNHEWISLYKSGVFANNSNTIDLSFLPQGTEYKDSYEIDNLLLLPLTKENQILGCIIIGNKINGTYFTRDEIVLLQELKKDCIELFYNAHALNNIQKNLESKVNRTSMLSNSLIDAIESEKKNLSTLLHDEFLQSLILLSNKLEEETLSGNVNVLAFNKLEKSLNNLINDIRNTCFNLYPVIVEDLGLQISLETLKKEAAINHDISIDIIYKLDYKVISIPLSIQIFKIIREIVNNSIKHSKSEKIIVYLNEINKDLYIKVEDFGIGFEYNEIKYLSNKNLGLITTQKRVKQLDGKLDIYSKLKHGTSIVVTIPNKRSEDFVNQGAIS